MEPPEERPSRKARRAADATWRRLERRQRDLLQRQIARRRCSECTVCCTVKGIGELQKPAGQHCPHMAPEGTSCLIYGRHPRSCRGYYCAWRKGFLGADERPDLIGVLFEHGRTVLVPGVRVIVAREAHDGALDAVQELLGALARKWIVIKVRGDERSALGPPEVMATVTEKLKGTSHIQVDDGSMGTEARKR